MESVVPVDYQQRLEMLQRFRSTSSYEDLKRYEDRIKEIDGLVQFKGRAFYPGCGYDFEWAMLSIDELVGIDNYKWNTRFDDAEKYAKIVSEKTGKPIRLIHGDVVPLEDGYDVLIDKQGLSGILRIPQPTLKEGFDNVQSKSEYEEKYDGRKVRTKEIDLNGEDFFVVYDDGKEDLVIYGPPDSSGTSKQILLMEVDNFHRALRVQCTDIFTQKTRLTFPFEKEDIKKECGENANLVMNEVLQAFMKQENCLGAFNKYLRKLRVGGHYVSCRKINGLKFPVDINCNGYGVFRPYEFLGHYLSTNGFEEVPIDEGQKTRSTATTEGSWEPQWAYLTGLSIFKKVREVPE